MSKIKIEIGIGIGIGIGIDRDYKHAIVWYLSLVNIMELEKDD
jgi:hypothetical protein